jgi:hypothetical protein
MYTAQDVRKLPSGPKAFNHQHSFNPNCTRQGQNWPRRHWCQIPNKILLYRILENTYFCLNIFRIFFNFSQGVKKLHFDINFEKFMSKAQSWHNHTVPPIFHLVTLLFQTTWMREKSQCLWPGVQCMPVSIKSVISPRPYTLRGGGSSVGSAL